MLYIISSIVFVQILLISVVMVGPQMLIKVLISIHEHPIVHKILKIYLLIAAVLTGGTLPK